jgi:predicted cobalt transporter CbtA
MHGRKATEEDTTMATMGDSHEPGPAATRTAAGLARRSAWFPARQDYTSETKPFYLTSEFLVFALYLMGLAIAASTSPSIDARLFWILSTIAVVGYMLSRGIAKAATRSRAHDPREDIDLGRN